MKGLPPWLEKEKRKNKQGKGHGGTGPNRLPHAGRVGYGEMFSKLEESLIDSNMGKKAVNKQLSNQKTRSVIAKTASQQLLQYLEKKHKRARQSGTGQQGQRNPGNSQRGSGGKQRTHRHSAPKLQPPQQVSLPETIGSQWQKLPIHNWSEDEVSAWLQSLSLSKNYSKIIQSKQVKGKDILHYKPDHLIAVLEVQCFGDSRILQQSLPRLLLQHPAAPPPTRAISTNTTINDFCPPVAVNTDHLIERGSSSEDKDETDTELCLTKTQQQLEKLKDIYSSDDAEQLQAICERLKSGNVSQDQRQRDLKKKKVLQAIGNKVLERRQLLVSVKQDLEFTKRDTRHQMAKDMEAFDMPHAALRAIQEKYYERDKAMEELMGRSARAGGNKRWKDVKHLTKGAAAFTRRASTVSAVSHHSHHSSQQGYTTMSSRLEHIVQKQMGQQQPPDSLTVSSLDQLPTVSSLTASKLADNANDIDSPTREKEKGKRKGVAFAVDSSSPNQTLDSGVEADTSEMATGMDHLTVGVKSVKEVRQSRLNALTVSTNNSHSYELRSNSTLSSRQSHNDEAIDALYNELDDLGDEWDSEASFESARTTKSAINRRKDTLLDSIVESQQATKGVPGGVSEDMIKENKEIKRDLTILKEQMQHLTEQLALALGNKPPTDHPTKSTSPTVSFMLSDDHSDTNSSLPKRVTISTDIVTAMETETPQISPSPSGELSHVTTPVSEEGQAAEQPSTTTGTATLTPTEQFAALAIQMSQTVTENSEGDEISIPASSTAPIALEKGEGTSPDLLELLTEKLLGGNGTAPSNKVNGGPTCVLTTTAALYDNPVPQRARSPQLSCVSTCPPTLLPLTTAYSHSRPTAQPQTAVHVQLATELTASTDQSAPQTEKDTAQQNVGETEHHPSQSGQKEEPHEIQIPGGIEQRDKEVTEKPQDVEDPVTQNVEKQSSDNDDDDDDDDLENLVLSQTTESSANSKEQDHEAEVGTVSSQPDSIPSSGPSAIHLTQTTTTTTPQAKHDQPTADTEVDENNTTKQTTIPVDNPQIETIENNPTTQNTAPTTTTPTTPTTTPTTTTTTTVAPPTSIPTPAIVPPTGDRDEVAQQVPAVPNNILTQQQQQQLIQQLQQQLQQQQQAIVGGQQPPNMNANSAVPEIGTLQQLALLSQFMQQPLQQPAQAVLQTNPGGPAALLQQLQQQSQNQAKLMNQVQAMLPAQ